MALLTSATHWGCQHEKSIRASQGIINILQCHLGKRMSERQRSFIEMGILPELLGRWFSCPPEQNTSSPSTSTHLPPRGRLETASPSSHGTNLKYCYCQEGEHGKMVGCDNPGCPYQWFHLECLRLKSAPRSKLWYCPDCRKHEKFRKSK